MYRATVKEQHRAEFEARLAEVRPALERARYIVGQSTDRGLHAASTRKHTYVTGGCAAWLIGRADAFTDVDVLMLPHHEVGGRDPEPRPGRAPGPERSSWDERAARWLGREFGAWGAPAPSAAPAAAAGGAHDGTGYLTLVYPVGAHTLKLGVSGMDVTRANACVSEFAATAVFVGLFDPGRIYTGECRCPYEQRCVVTRNGCALHGRVVYPLLFDASAMETSHAYYGLRRRHRRLMRRANQARDAAAERTRLARHTDAERLVKWAVRLHPEGPDPHEYRAMSFLEYDCDRCDRRRRLARKYFTEWMDRTYRPPRGHGYMNVLRRHRGERAPAAAADPCTCDPGPGCGR